MMHWYVEGIIQGALFGAGIVLIPLLHIVRKKVTNAKR